MSKAIQAAIEEALTNLIGMKETGDGVSFSDSGELIIEGFMATYNNIDSEGDIVLPGAFVETIAQFKEKRKTNPRTLPLMYRHRWPIGYVLDMEDQEKGVWVKAVIEENSDAGKFVANLVRSKEVKGLSYHFYDGLGRKAEGVRYLTKLLINEVTVTPFPANELSLVKSFKKNKELYKVWKDMILNFIKADGGLTNNEARLMFAEGVKSFKLEDQRLEDMTKIMDDLIGRIGASKSQ